MCAIGLLAAFLLRDVTRCTVFAMSHATLMLLLLKLEGTSYGWPIACCGSTPPSVTAALWRAPSLPLG